MVVLQLALLEKTYLFGVPWVCRMGGRSDSMKLWLLVREHAKVQTPTAAPGCADPCCPVAGLSRMRGCRSRATPVAPNDARGHAFPRDNLLCFGDPVWLHPAWLLTGRRRIRSARPLDSCAIELVYRHYWSRSLLCPVGWLCAF